MDGSLNLINLRYLSNPHELNKLTRDKKIPDVSTDDIKFYKKRIFQLTKGLLQGQDKDVKITRAFQIYAKTLIENFKFKDKMEIIQKDYKNAKKSVTKATTFDLDATNILMMKNKTVRIPKITDNIKITSTRIIKAPIIPKQRNFDLKNSKFKEKGLKKKI